MATDFPEPVDPAMSRCGIFSKLAIIGSPVTSRPKINPKEPELINSGKVIKLPSRTMAAALFGTSIPTKDFPGIGASILMG